MTLDTRRRGRAIAANALRPGPPFFDFAPVQTFRANNFDLFFFNDPHWVEKIRGFETLFRFHRASELLDLMHDLELEYRDRDDSE